MTKPVALTLELEGGRERERGREREIDEKNVVHQIDKRKQLDHDKSGCEKKQVSLLIAVGFKQLGCSFYGSQMFIFRVG